MEEHEVDICVGTWVFTCVDEYVYVQHLIYDMKAHTKYEKIATL